ncbi:TPA: alpha/beta hydrolase [Clostridioides difficile]|nr:alpha/beta hydrolase [Clostridioides difficile]HBF3323561.1 alpha/beta hydrolase [Clostridioides difficile]HBF8628101.1 alpha/beta hydrolase [Clostridioides difficile]HBF9365347.1 alpha/beta hydrolase [Clostridioides difficile]HEK8902624.1 alpha/beta hydrolase [Clostridioides difficile]
MSYFIYQSKKIFYSETGNGIPVIMLHGDTASSTMFEMLLPLYQENFKVILIDFLGNGKSDRVDEFPADLWITQAQQVIALIEHLKYKKVNLIGTSGGAWVAVNTALERPDLINKVVADSFDGRTLADDFAKNLVAEREFAKNDELSKQFYEWCQGEDWENVVDLNTKALTECARKKLPLFLKPLETLSVPILFLGSLEDTMCRNDLLKEYEEMKQLVTNGTIHFFKTGGHPAIATNAELSAKVITEFIDN